MPSDNLLLQHNAVMLMCDFLFFFTAPAKPACLKVHRMYTTELQIQLDGRRQDISEFSLTPIPNAMPSSCMSLPLFCNCSRWVCSLCSAARDSVWIFWAALLHTEQSTINPAKTFLLIVTFVKRCQEAASCQSSTHIELTHIGGTVLHAHVSPPSKHPFLCPNDWQGFNIATRDEKSPPSSSPSSPPPSCSILICSYGPQPVAS